MRLYKTSPKGFKVFVICSISCGVILCIYFLVWMMKIIGNPDLLTLLLMIIIMALLAVASVVTVAVTFIIALFLLIQDTMERPSEPIPQYRVFTLAIVVLSAAILLLTWQINPNNPKVIHKAWLRDIAGAQDIVDKIHSGEKIPYLPSIYSIDVAGEEGHEDVFFYEISYGQADALNYYRGYLYSEDDNCDVDIRRYTVNYMRHIKGNWYYIEID